MTAFEMWLQKRCEANPGMNDDASVLRITVASFKTQLKIAFEAGQDDVARTRKAADDIRRAINQNRSGKSFNDLFGGFDEIFGGK